MTSIDLVNGSFKYNILLMKILGLYPYDRWPQYYALYAYLFYILFTFSAPLLPTINLIIVQEQDMAKIADSAFLIVEIGILLVKLLPFKNNPEGIKRTIHTLTCKIFNDYGPQQTHIAKHTVSTCKDMFLIFFMFCMASLFSWPFKVLLYEDRRFPIDIWLPFEALEDIRVYLSVFLFLFLGVANAPLGNASIDTLIAGLIYHAAGQLKIFKDTLQYLDQRVEEQISKIKLTCIEKEELKAKLTYEKICHCINHYEAIFKFVKDLEDTYSFVVFSQFTASIIVICISCLQLSIVDPFNITFFAMLIYVITMLTEIFLYCYFGTVLYDESNTIINAIYMSKWYKYDEKSRKALVTLMEIAKRPMLVTVGKLFDMSLNTFTMIIRRSYSLLAVLKNY